MRPWIVDIEKLTEKFLEETPGTINDKATRQYIIDRVAESSMFDQSLSEKRVLKRIWDAWYEYTVTNREIV